MGYVYHICEDCGIIVDFDEERECCEECNSYNLKEVCIEEKQLCGKKENCYHDQLILDLERDI